MKAKVDTAKWILAVVFAAGVAYAGMVGTKAEVEEMRTEIKTHDRAIVELKRDVVYIREGVDELLDKKRKKR